MWQWAREGQALQEGSWKVPSKFESAHSSPSDRSPQSGAGAGPGAEPKPDWIEPRKHQGLP
ncbi:hypothetical protein N658DRAFT_500710 [Parathielavia hyrcaniae]|uniref:Uncharacterized protein n=1 Tax=Parathielavia hyrcaniae TaxID=113614 RepID=A0AAN6SY58_9PEZI|nr:hypothetical protein N658DRAFT_500710 [Parathielavia hyrcaniae]